MVPELLARKIDAYGPVIAKVGIDAFTVRAGRAGSEAVLVLRLFWRSRRSERLPEQLAVGTAQAKEGATLAVVVGRGQEDAVLPDDGRRIPLAGQVGFPEDVLRVGPGIG